VNGIVRAIRGTLQWLLGADVELVTRLSPAPVRVSVDAAQVEKVLITLAANAREAMEGAGRLTIETARVKTATAIVHAHGTIPPGHHAVLSVGDTSAGLDEEIQARVFEPFFLTPEIDWKRSGAGLEMSTVYGIVQQSGGHILVDSGIGRGTVFKIYLTLVRDS
jgi:two-component system cell cycle sensor histidine kinase/response regulator CckA